MLSPLLALSTVLVLAAFVFFPPFSAAFSSFIFSLLSVVSPLAIFLICSLGKSLLICLVNSCRNKLYCPFFALAVSSGTSVSRSLVNWSLVLGLKMCSEERSIAFVGSDSSVSVTALPVRDLLMLRSPNSSSACAREPSSSCWRSRMRRSSSVSSSSLSSPFRRRRRLASRCSSIRCALVFLFALASASALALASAAFLVFSRSTSESSAASHDSRTCHGGVSMSFCAWRGRKLCMAGYGKRAQRTSLSSSSSSNLLRRAMVGLFCGEEGVELSSSSSSVVLPVSPLSSVAQGT